MIQKYIYAITTYDTKSEEAEFIKCLIQDKDIQVKTLDVSTQPNESIADYSNTQIAQYSHEKVFCGNRGTAILRMTDALKSFVLEHINEISGVIGLGGSGGTALITPMLQTLPIGLPKIMISTMASGNVANYVGSSDINMLYSVTDIAGVNNILRPILINAAHQMMGAVFFEAPKIEIEQKPTVGLTMFGVTTPSIQKTIEQLSDTHNCIVFHATGAGGNSMEKLIKEGLINSAIDLTTTEICDYLFGGVLASDGFRLDAAAQTRIPYVISCGALDMINFGNKNSVPNEFKDRLIYEHNAEVTLIRTTIQENKTLGEWIGRKLNSCDGEIRFLIPLKGFSALDAIDQPFWSPEADQAFIDALENTVIQNSKRKIIKINHHINDDAFVANIIQEFKQLTNP